MTKLERLKATRDAAYAAASAAFVTDSRDAWHIAYVASCKAYAAELKKQQEKTP
jgi:hypothetical protein